MARSYRTRPLAARAEGPEEVRIVRLRPVPGDWHPLDKPELRDLLERIPPQYVGGLSRVELRAREDRYPGFPYGRYHTDEKSVLLFSVPRTSEWIIPARDQARGINAETFGATYSDWSVEGEGALRWRDEDAVFHYYCFILLHELGHHFVYRSRSRRKMPGADTGHEAVADYHAVKLFETVLAEHDRRPEPALYEKLWGTLPARFQERAEREKEQPNG